MLNPVVRWEPGLRVRYHGSVTHLHGVYRAHPCTCLNCTDSRGLGSARFRLVDGKGRTVLDCVRAHSITTI